MAYVRPALPAGYASRAATPVRRGSINLCQHRGNSCSRRLLGTLEHTCNTSRRCARSNADSCRLYEPVGAPFLLPFSPLLASTLSRACLVSPSAGWPRNGNSGARSVGVRTRSAGFSSHSSKVPSLSLTQDHPYGFWAKPKKAADGTLDMKTWETGIPGKEGVSRSDSCAVTALFPSTGSSLTNLFSLLLADHLGRRSVPRHAPVSRWCVALPSPTLSGIAGPVDRELTELALRLPFEASQV